jgi:RNA polymerase sigma factor (sigma-70 family)
MTTTTYSVDSAPTEAATLLSEAASGTGSAWQALVARHRGLLTSIGRSFRLPPEVVEDVMQDTWLELARHITSLRQPEKVGSWLATTMRHGCLRAKRQQRQEVPLDEWPWTTLADPAPAVDTQVIRREQRRALWDAVGTLPTRQRELVHALAALESYTDVGDHLGMPLGAIGPTRARAVRQLRDRLGSTGWDLTGEDQLG